MSGTYHPTSLMRWIGLPIWVLGLLALSQSGHAEKYFPDHPVVKGMVDRGIAYLSKGDSRNDPTSPAGGVDILVGYTIYKVNADPDDPVVRKAINSAKSYLDGLKGSSRFESKAVYVLSVAVMLLASVDPDQYGPTLIAARDFILSIQQTTGGFGYIDGSHKATSSDISQTQYVMLALWTLSQIGMEIPEDRIGRAIGYLAESQMKDPMPDRNGAWPYQYEPGGKIDERFSNSLTTAGLSAVLIAGDALGLYRNRIADADDDGLIPAAFRRIIPEVEKKKKTASVDRNMMEQTVNRGVLYNKNNPYSRTTWHYYYLYSKERFESFYEFSLRKIEKSPDWYNVEVEQLIANQAADGSWGTKQGDVDMALGGNVSTCFAVLFLIRSTQKAIASMKSGMNRGFLELPTDITSVTLVGGKPVSANAATSIDDALKIIQEKENLGAEKLVADNIVMDRDPVRRREQLNRFARLLRSKDFTARRIAAKVLGRGDDLELVPELIFALGDGDSVVSRNAETSLRLISRQLDKYHLPKDGVVSEQDRIVAAREWKRWYLDLKPDYIFVE